MPPIEGENEQELEGQDEEGNQDESEEGKGEEGKRGPNGWIPKVRFDEVIAKVHGLETTLQQEREARIRLEEQTRKPSTPERYTKQQLREAVATGQLTQDQADDIWDAQREAEITEKVVGAVKQTTAQSQAAAKIDADLKRYKELIPDIVTEGTESRGKLVEAYNYLRSIGHPDGPATHLAAAMAAFGPVERVEKRSKGRTVTQTHEETGGGGKPSNGGKKSLLDQAPARYKAHYESLLAKGLTTPEKVEKELARIGIGQLNDRAKRYG